MTTRLDQLRLDTIDLGTAEVASVVVGMRKNTEKTTNLDYCETQELAKYFARRVSLSDVGSEKIVL